MKSKFIIQIKRRYYWEDVLAYFDRKQAFVSYLKLISEGQNVRLLELRVI